jgi:alkylation response protein AidB-like acyl-CoA dehydrogenase
MRDGVDPREGMDFDLSEDQEALVAAAQAVLRRGAELPQAARLGFCHFDGELQNRLRDGGFLDAARDMGALEAALVVIEAARVAAVVEVGASAMVAPQLLPEDRIDGPVALVAAGALHKAQRNLSVARTAVIDLGDDVVVLPLAEGEIAAVDSALAYPFGRFRAPPDLARGRRLGAAAVATLRHWWRAALAAEFSGAAQSAVAFTIDYVKERRVFGRPIGAFQAVQHRLAQCHQIARGIHLLALKAAWSGRPLDADIAASYAQQHVHKFMFDLHQFNGAMGVTNEHLLHFWLYRLRALQAEAGGASGSALAIADRLWGPRGEGP